MQDGLYLSDTLVSEVEVSLVFQGNDITKPDARTASFSNTFTLPDSLAIRDLLQGAEQIDAAGIHPYRQLPAKLIDEGETIFTGIAEFVSFQAGWKVNLLDSIVSFFDAIKDKPLTSLDLSRLDHPWTLKHITSIAGSADGVTYPLIDYGGISEGVVPYDTMCPAVYVKTLFGQICSEAGYKPVGEWLKDPLLLALALPFVGSDPKAHDQEWVDDRTARVTGNGATNGIVLKNGSPINLILPFSQDNLPVDDFTQGRLRPYKTDRFAYVCPSRMRVTVTAQVEFISLVKFGAADISFILERNGQQVAKTDYSKGGYYDGLDTPETLQIDEAIDCLAGDELTLRLTGSSRTTFSDYAYYFSLASGDSWASFVPDASVHLGDIWPVSPNLPDMSCSDLALTLAKAMQGTFEVDEQRRTVKLIPLDNVIDNIATAADWSTKVDETDEPEMMVQFEGYGKNNLCKWREADEKVNIGYGDGVISSPVISTPREATLFELPFMACIDSSNVIGGYGNPILIKTRTFSGTGDNRNINKIDAAPRLILMEPTKSVPVQTETLSLTGDLVKEPVTLTACWWAKRPAGIRNDANSFTLAFSPIPNQTEQPLIDRYFKTLKRVLRRPKMVTLSVYLQPADIATLNLSVPIRLQRVRVGSIEINDNYFYLNKLGPYRSGQSSTAVLIAV